MNAGLSDSQAAGLPVRGVPTGSVQDQGQASKPRGSGARASDQVQDKDCARLSRQQVHPTKEARVRNLESEPSSKLLRQNKETCRFMCPKAQRHWPSETAESRGSNQVIRAPSHTTFSSAFLCHCIRFSLLKMDFFIWGRRAATSWVDVTALSSTPLGRASPCELTL